VVVLILLTAGVTAAAAPPPNWDEVRAKAEETKKLQGRWKIVRVEMAGQEIPLKEADLDEIVVVGEKMTFKEGDKESFTVGFEVYPNSKPKGMLWKKETEEGTGTHPLVYEIDGTKLRLCFPLLTKKAPKEAPKPPEGFDTKGKPLVLVVAERVKE
jgi:uncharacterized protein (TIGR03067 family)